MARLNIGGRQARRLCQMSAGDRLTFIAEGLPIILESARGFWNASTCLSDAAREAEVLTGLAKEEASKIFILLDIIRCPPTIASARLGIIISHFYDHLARLIYASAQTWPCSNVAQLREYVDQERRSHSVEGFVGECILPNSTKASRESLLYADIEAYETGKLIWNNPKGLVSGLSSPIPTVLQVAEAMSALGVFTSAGLSATAAIWGQVEFRETETSLDSERLLQVLLQRLIEEGLPSDVAEQEHVNLLYRFWQMPMYNLDFHEVDVALADLQKEREALMWAEYGPW